MTARKMALGLLIAVSVYTRLVTAQETFAPNVTATRNALRDGKIAQALAYHERKAREAEQAALTSASPASLWASATVHYREANRAARMSGQVQKMLIYGEKTLETARKTGKPGHEIFAVSELVDAYRYVRDFRKVGELIEQGMAILPKLPQNSRVEWESRFYDHLGTEHIRLRRYEAAIDAHTYAVNSQNRHLALFRRAPIGDPAKEAAQASLLLRVMNLGDAYRLANKLDEALAQYQRALSLVKVLRLKYFNEGEIHASLGAIYLRQKRYPDALERLNEALSFAESQGNPSNLITANNRIGDTLRQLGKPAEALPYYQRAIQQVESARSLLESQDYRQSFFAGGLKAYSSIIETSLAANRPEDAFNYSERARSRVFLDVLGTKVQLGRQAQGAGEENQLKARIEALRGRATDANTDEELENGENLITQAQRNKELAAAEKAYAEFLSKVRNENKEQASLMNVEPLTVKQVQDLLDPGVTMLQYFVTQDALLTWIVEKDKVDSVRTPLRRGQLQSKVTSFRESIQQFEDKEKLTQQSEELYKFLIHPALPHIKGKELLIIPHDVLHYVPFQALLSPSGKYLIEDYPINYLSSASLMQFTQEKRNARGELRKILADGGKVLTFGNPDLDDPAMALKFAGIEAKEIKNLYPQSAIYLEKEATEEKAKALVGNSDIIHFASHAELNEDDPLASAIRLAKSDKEDGRLEVREIFGMDLKASLVVLSACETGLGKLSSGDELVGLTRAFIYAGTPSVVASLWNVEDSSTAQLMASFYKNLKTMTKVEALRQAQLNLIRGNVNSDLLARRGIGGIGKLGEVPGPKAPSQDSVSISTSHPFFWAPFILVGEGK